MSTIIISNLNFVHLLQYNNELKIRYHKVDNIPKIIYFGKGCLVSCISCFICPSKPIREKYPNLTKTHKLENLVSIAENENKIHRKSSVSIV